MRSMLTGSLVFTIALALAGCNAQRPLHILYNDAVVAAKAKDYAKSRADYQEYLVRRPDDPEIRYELSQVCMGQGDYKEAVRQLIIASDVRPLEVKYLDALAEALYYQGDRDALTNFLSRLTQERAGVADYLRLGKYSLKIGNVDEAKQALLTAAKLDAGTTVAPQLELSDFFGKLGDRTRQVDRLRMAYFIEPANPDVLKKARELGEILGPGAGLYPTERDPAAANR